MHWIIRALRIFFWKMRFLLQGSYCFRQWIHHQRIFMWDHWKMFHLVSEESLDVLRLIQIYLQTTWISAIIFREIKKIYIVRIKIFHLDQCIRHFWRLDLINHSLSGKVSSTTHICPFDSSSRKQEN